MISFDDLPYLTPDDRNADPHRKQRNRCRTICVVHLVREVYGPEPFRSFIDSYSRYGAGVDHEIVLLCKGFQGDSLPREWTRVLSVPFQAIFLPDVGMDIPSYFEAARRVDHDLICFVNTWSRILTDDWLAFLYEHALTDGVGVVGATGAWWSLYTARLLQLEQQAAQIVLPRADCSLARHLSKYLERVLMKHAIAKSLEPIKRDFPPFPNVFLRTNTFMVGRKLFLTLSGGGGLTKYEALRFEGGSQSMTTQVRRRGLKVLVVGRDGAAYEPLQWPKSKTYRSGAQENLLVSDNRTEIYTRASASGKQMLQWLAWGQASEGKDIKSLSEVSPLTVQGLPGAEKVFVG